MRNQKYNQMDINEQDIEYYLENEKEEKKKGIGKFAKFLITVLILALVGQIGYFGYTNRNLFFKSKVQPVKVEVTPKEKITLTAYEQKTDANVKAIPTFVGEKSEAVAVANDFAAKYLTMSNLKTQVDFLGEEYVYPNDQVKKDFREYALTNYYYYFSDIQKNGGQLALPEVESSKIVTIDEINYIHENVEKVPGYAYSITNDRVKDDGFMKKKFKGYSIELSVSYVLNTKTQTWIKNAPTTMQMIVLFDADSGKWFMSEFQTNTGSDTNNNVPITNPKGL